MAFENTYIDIDSLMDTRLMVVEQLSPEWMEKIANSPDYTRRLNDDFSIIFPDFPQDAYNALWDNRGTIALSNVKHLTGVLQELRIDATERAGAEFTDAGMPGTKLVINQFPYKLTPKEIDDLVMALSTATSFTEFKVISRSPDLLIPEFFHNDFTEVIMYDFDQWLNFHYKRLMDFPIFKTTFKVPLLVKGKIEGKLNQSLEYIVNESIEQLKVFLGYNPKYVSIFSAQLETDKLKEEAIKENTQAQQAHNMSVIHKQRRMERRKKQNKKKRL